VPGDEPDRRPVVLVVEDEFEVRYAVAEYLRSMSYSVIEAVSTADAMTVFTSGVGVDIAFVDFKLPGGLNGLMLAKWLETTRPKLPVLLTSGLTMTIFGFGSDNKLRRFIAKPYVFSELAAQIKDMLVDVRT
jgi:CheY-like chemotaxis protein